MNQFPHFIQKLIKKISSFFTPTPKPTELLHKKEPKRKHKKSPHSKGPKGATQIKVQEHSIRHHHISPNALKVLQRLSQHGFEAYLVGGGVRDLLLGLKPKDFDIVTNAHPEQVRQVFRNCRLIGRRFRLAHVYFGREIVEVATFRAHHQDRSTSHSQAGVILQDNVYGTIVDDVWRRDFTINALYYNIANSAIVDFTDGYKDLKAKRLRMIGDPFERYREDPVRILRAIRFGCKTKFGLNPELTESFLELKSLISHVAPARLFEEIIKMFHSGAAQDIYQTLCRYDLFQLLFPLTFESLQNPEYKTDALLNAIFKNTDLRIAQGKSVTPAFIVAALLWHPLCHFTKQHLQQNLNIFDASDAALDAITFKQNKSVSIPKRIIQGAREIWLLQLRLEKNADKPKRVKRMIQTSRFRAAYDFLELRLAAGEDVQKTFNYWQRYIHLAPVRTYVPMGDVK